jgi:hypothetical protein
MEKINEIDDLIKDYINNNCLILQNTKPNLSKLWHNFLTIYCDKLINNLKQFETIVNTNEITNDFSIDTIQFLYILHNLQLT